VKNIITIIGTVDDLRLSLRDLLELYGNVTMKDLLEELKD
jgi:hypothetical protein